MLGVQDVLTPISADRPGYPTQTEREFGPWGLSFASDRWDLRRAIVLEGRAQEERGGEQVDRFIQYIDVQTLAPLYFSQDGGWRRESWEIMSTPPDAGTLERMLSVSNLTKRR